MTPELLTAIASVGTLAVITATAIAGFVQLRHLRASNQIEALDTFRNAFETSEIRDLADAMPGIRARLNDPQGRAELQVANPPWMRSAMPSLRLFEILGIYVRQGIVSKRIVCDMWSPVIVGYWGMLEPLIVVMRRRSGISLFENFEMIAHYSKQWLADEVSTYPKRVPRIAAPDPWAAVDAKSAAETSVK